MNHKQQSWNMIYFTISVTGYVLNNSKNRFNSFFIDNAQKWKPTQFWASWFSLQATWARFA